MRKLVYLLVFLNTVSCVSMKKFSSVSVELARLKNDSIVHDLTIKAQAERIDDLLRRNISLGSDTLRLFSDYVALQDKYERLHEEDREEIARLSAQIYGTSKRTTNNNAKKGGRVSTAATALTKSISLLGDELKSALNNDNKTLYNIDTKNWEVVITLRDTLLYTPVWDNGRVVYDYNQLTRSGEILLKNIASMIIEKDNFDVVVREYVYINSPNLRYIPNAKSQDLGEFETEIITAVIDTLMTRGMMTINTHKNIDSVKVNHGVIDVEQSRRLDSINAVRETERIKREEVEARAEMVRKRERARRMNTDKTTVIMRTLMRSCYTNLGSSKVSKDASYVKVNHVTDRPNNEWVEIILRPNITELYNIVKELENRNK